MGITRAQHAYIELHLPTQRGNVAHDNLNVTNAILFVAENGCRWRALPNRSGNWHTVYTPLREGRQARKALRTTA